MGTKADLYRDTALSLVGEEYEWGEEPLYDQDPDSNPNDGDCSGTCWALWKAVGVELPRLTAEMYRRRGTPISGPSKVGADYWCLLRADGTAHHIGAFIGKGETFEAKGEAYGMLKSTVAAVNKRGAKWYRMPGVDLGELSPDVPAPVAGIVTSPVYHVWSKPSTDTRVSRVVDNVRPGESVTILADHGPFWNVRTAAGIGGYIERAHAIKRPVS